jgi:hypothetical protein
VTPMVVASAWRVTAKTVPMSRTSVVPASTTKAARHYARP